MVAPRVADFASACLGAAPPRALPVAAVPVPLVALYPQQGSSGATGWPVTLGVPFAPGALPAGTPIGVVDDQGRPIPAQVETVAK